MSIAYVSPLTQALLRSLLSVAVKEFGARIKRRRLALKLSQAKVAKAVGRSRPWLVALEQGDGNPPAEVVTALAIALEEDPRDYLKMLGRVALTAEDLRPVRINDLPPETAAAVERAVASAIAPLVERIDQLLTLLEERPADA